MSRGRQQRLGAREMAPTLFTHARSLELLDNPAVRAVARRTGVSPTLALVIVELAGLTKEQK